MTNHTTATYDALVDLTKSLRPGWHTEGIRNAIRQALQRDPMPHLADLAYALTRCAIDPTITTPAVLPLDGPHWRNTATAGGARIQAKTKCAECGTRHAADAPHVPKLAHHRNPGPAKARAALHQALGSTNHDE